MMASWIRGWALPLLAMAFLSACQAPPGYREGYARPTYAAAPSCDPYQYAPPRDCYQRPVRRAARSYCAPGDRCQEQVRYRAPRSSCEPAYRSQRSSFRYARAPSRCAPAYRPRTYRYVGERVAPACGPTYRRSYQRYRPAYDYDTYRPPRYRQVSQYYRSDRNSSCCY